MKGREKGFQMNPVITYFPVFIIDILKVEIGEIVTKKCSKRSRGQSQRT